MKNPQVLMFLIIFPMLVGLACLQTTYPMATEAASTPVQDLRATVPAAEAAALIESTPTGPAPACALISANEALHLRLGPGPNALVLAFMRRGEVVKLLSTTNEDWWLIKRGGLIGYARSRYMDRAECR